MSWGLVHEQEKDEAGDLQAHRDGGCSEVDAQPVPCGEDGAVSEGKALDLWVDLCSDPCLWS